MKGSSLIEHNRQHPLIDRYRRGISYMDGLARSRKKLIHMPFLPPFRTFIDRTYGYLSMHSQGEHPSHTSMI